MTTRQDEALSKRELLAKQFAAMWTRDAQGRIESENDHSGTLAPLIAVGVTVDGQRLVACSSVCDDSDREELVASLRRRSGPVTPAETTEIRQMVGDVEITEGPTFAVPRSLSEISVDARVVWCADDGAAQLIDADPLVFPTWAVVVVEDKVVSVCNTVRQTVDAAEAGVNTERRFRGRGYAAAATRLWAERMRPRSLFYSTSNDNRSSLRVAQRLNLEQIGTIWSARHR
jgi:RimJ/RimL family protein N-acetyltransferase